MLFIKENLLVGVVVDGDDLTIKDGYLVIQNIKQGSPLYLPGVSLTDVVDAIRDMQANKNSSKYSWIRHMIYPILEDDSISLDNILFRIMSVIESSSNTHANIGILNVGGKGYTIGLMESNETHNIEKGIRKCRFGDWDAIKITFGNKSVYISGSYVKYTMLNTLVSNAMIFDLDRVNEFYRYMFNLCGLPKLSLYKVFTDIQENYHTYRSYAIEKQNRGGCMESHNYEKPIGENVEENDDLLEGLNSCVSIQEYNKVRAELSELKDKYKELIREYKRYMIKTLRKCTDNLIKEMEENGMTIDEFKSNIMGGFQGKVSDLKNEYGDVSKQLARKTANEMRTNTEQLKDENDHVDTREK